MKWQGLDSCFHYLNLFYKIQMWGMGVGHPLLTFLQPYCDPKSLDLLKYKAKQNQNIHQYNETTLSLSFKTLYFMRHESQICQNFKNKTRECLC